MLYPVDYPLLTPATIARLVHGFAEREAGQSIVAPVSRRRSGHPVLFASELRRELAAAETAREVVYRDAARVKFVSVRTEAIWQDLDSPAAYRARQRSFARRPAALAFAGASK
jgi:CTP:molybdopterin cytidylyltransferase MocA